MASYDDRYDPVNNPGIPANTQLLGGGDTGVGNYSGDSVTPYNHATAQQPYSPPLGQGGGAPNPQPYVPNPGSGGMAGLYDGDIRPTSDGHIWLFVRNPTTGGGKWEDGGTDINAMSQKYGIPVSVVQQVVDQHNYQAAQTQKNTNQIGYGQVLSYNADGTVTVENPDGTREAKSMADALKTPGVTASDIQQAQAQFQRYQSYINSANLWEVKNINDDGTVTIQNGVNDQKTVPQGQAMQFNGVTEAALRSAQLSANDQSWQMQGFSYPGVDTGGQAQTPWYQQPPGQTAPGQRPGDGSMPPAPPNQTPGGRGYPYPLAGAAGGADASGAMQGNVGYAPSAGTSLTDPNAQPTGRQSLTAPQGMGAADSGGSGMASTLGGVQMGSGAGRSVMPQTGGGSASTQGSGYNTNYTGMPSRQPVGMPTGLTNQQADQQARQAQTARTLAARGQYQYITGADNGTYSGKNFLGQSVNLTADQAINSGSATKEDLQRAQSQYGQDVAQTGAFLRAHMSRFLSGYDPNQLQSQIVR